MLSLHMFLLLGMGFTIVKRERDTGGRKIASTRKNRHKIVLLNTNQAYECSS